jgi:hypothetical protein
LPPSRPPFPPPPPHPAVPTLAWRWKEAVGLSQMIPYRSFDA